MKVQIRPSTFVVSAIRGDESVGFSVDSAVTALLATNARVPIDQMKRIVVLKPYVKIRFSGGEETLMVSARFQCFKGNQIIHTTIVDRRYTDQMVFEPEDLPDIRPFQARSRMIGDWSLTVEIALFAARLLKQISPSSYPAFLSGLRYQIVTTYGFKVIRDESDIELTTTGRMVEPRRETDTVYTINDL